ncbi:nuclear transport factor 2 family protein [Flavobacterium gillisiae]|uniref:nuclear transport factor 2 family protein n=1 Tax=Flavobacterium gillisiae TaxID=150146 RepID=UPI001FDEC81D|nr:nuclear transport factor 2 family protein [Flavobacterium gillisiae]
MYKAFAAGDMPTVLGAMHPDIVWNEAESNALADGNPYIGPDAILNGIFVRLGANHEYFNLKGIQLHNMSDNKVLATLRYDAKVITTGKTYNAQAAHLWILNDAGKIMSFQQYVDTKKLADAEK